MDGTILIADDDRTIRTVLTQAFTRAGCKVHATASLVTLLRWVEEGRGDLVISDVIMPDGNGLEALPRIAGLRPDLPVIVISAQNTIMTAIRATEAAAYDYLPKPFDLPDLMKRAARALDATRRPSPEVQSALGDDLPLVGRTPIMQDLYHLISRVLNTDMPVLIHGESGTGKSLIARAIHDFSDRRGLPFVVIGPGDLRDVDRLHEYLSKAGRGTILIDGIGDLKPEVQAQLVRVLDTFAEGEPRLLASNLDDLAKAVEQGNFRADLYYRIAAISLLVPPLRQRVDDIVLLAEHFLAIVARNHDIHKSLASEAIDKIKEYSFPGNVRQLENLIQRLAITCREAEISAANVTAILGPDPGASASQAPENAKLAESISLHLQRYFDLHGEALPPDGLYARILREMEAPLLEIAMAATGGNQAKCADLLGINRNTLRKKLTEHDINVTRRRKMM